MTTLDVQTTLGAATDPADRRPVCTLMASIVGNTNPDGNTIRKLSAELNNSLKRKHPDLSLIVLGAAIVLHSNDNESIERVLPALEAYMDRGSITDMLPQEATGDFVRRQNALISFSKLAYYSSVTESTVSTIARLSHQAVACGRRKGDPQLIIAILQQLKQMHLTQGDPAAADQIEKQLQSEHDMAAAPPKPKDANNRMDREQLAEQLKAELRKSLLKPSP